MFIFIFFDNFYNAFFQLRLVHNDGLDSVCQNSFLRYGQMNSVFCSLLRFSMNLTIHYPGFEASAVKALRSILTREFSFQLILGFLCTSHSQYWKCGILIFSHFFSFHFHHGVEVDLLEDEGFTEMFSFTYGIQEL